ncbi:MAG: hypothetical protein B7X50_13525 [Alishewanella sp. 34-51-39]|nr:MAG: hypothetical protein B7X50_13525 [Alishewanella sp. 34-51-39]
MKKQSSKGIPTGFFSGLWYVVGSSVKMAYGCPLYDTELELAVDHDTAIVTREMWEAERAKLSKPKASAREWVRNRGRKNPFDVCTLVDARLRSGEVVVGKFSENLKFVHTGGLLDVMAYRVNESVDSETPEVTAPNDGPLQWRDRITEIDREVEALEEERASLIQKLADEGFKLIKREAVELPDMSNWRNWREGDLIVCTKEYGSGFKKGNMYAISEIVRGELNAIKVVSDENGEKNGWQPGFFKWHSRPTK